jgi:hypothetical protein
MLAAKMPHFQGFSSVSYESAFALVPFDSVEVIAGGFGHRITHAQECLKNGRFRFLLYFGSPT